MISEAAAAGYGDHLLVTVVLQDLAPHGQRVAGVAGHAEPDGHGADHRVRGPGRDVPLDQAGRGQDVDEDVPGAAPDGEVPVVVDVVEVTGGQGRGDDERRGHL